MKILLTFGGWLLAGEPNGRCGGAPRIMQPRAPPFGIRARLSGDRGRTWGEEIVLRADGGGRDLGYPRSAQRPDGRIVTVYYFHDEPAGDRYIAATIWDPKQVGR